MAEQGKQESVDRKAPRAVGPRLHHVAAHVCANVEDHSTGEPVYDDIVVFGTELEALRHIVGKTNWVYKPLGNGQPFSEAGS